MNSHQTNSRPINNLHIGTAGWTIPRQHAHLFPAQGSHLERHASIFNCVEINSSFHRPHMLKTWQRWATSTPENFRFSVKLPKTITHTAKLINTGALLQTFIAQIQGLGEKLGPLLVQLPPSLAFDEAIAHDFLTTLRELHPNTDPTNPIALEPRHATWFTPIADRLLRDFAIARVAADPPKGSPSAARPAGDRNLHYYRLHGSPRTYYSNYDEPTLTQLAQTFKSTPPTTTVWVIFDNTAQNHATTNALHLIHQLTP